MCFLSYKSKTNRGRGAKLYPIQIRVKNLNDLKAFIECSKICGMSISTWEGATKVEYLLMQVDSLNYLNVPNKTSELKQIEGIFKKNLLDDLITFRLKEIIRF